jgi:hypothetical protein
MSFQKIICRHALEMEKETHETLAKTTSENESAGQIN